MLALNQGLSPSTCRFSQLHREVLNAHVAEIRKTELRTNVEDLNANYLTLIAEAHYHSILDIFASSHLDLANGDGECISWLAVFNLHAAKPA